MTGVAEQEQGLERRVNVSKSEGSSERKTYSFDEAFRGALEYFRGDELAAKAWANKYSLKDARGNIYESDPDEMHHRIAREIARVESKYSNPMSEEKVYSLLRDFRYIVPQGSPMSGIGNDLQTVSLSNCFVIGNDADSYGGIIKTDEEQVQLMKRRGGVGHDLSNLRPSKTPVMNSALTSTGIVPFMERYSNSTREVAQDGRRGALMLSLSIKHPDAAGFIDAKMVQGKVTGANVSVRVDDEFMRAVEEGTTYTQQYPVDSDSPTITREIDARELWGKIIHNAWQSAEPGVLFWDTILRESVPDCYADLGYRTISTNPCGEIPLCPDDSCRLLAKNLYSYVEGPFTDGARFNWNLFRENVGYAQRMMDDIIDLELEKIDGILKKIESDPEDDETKSVERRLWERIRQKGEQGRRTGLGITGEGDMLAALGMTYGSDEAIEFSTRVHKTLAIEAYRSSVNLARERGAFEIYDTEREEDNPFIRRLAGEDPSLREDMKKYGRRNISLLTIAPTGTVSIMTQTSSGLEPAFLPVYERRRKVNPNDHNVNVDFVDNQGDSWEKYGVFHHKFRTWLEVKGYDVQEVERIANESIRDEKKARELEEIVKQSPYYRATSNDVDWLAKVRLQGAVQKWVDHSISVTINVPKDTSEELVDELYRTAWNEGCKGVTIYRDGSREGVLLTGEDEKTVTRQELSDLVMAQLHKSRPDDIRGRTEEIETPFGRAFVTFNNERENGGRHPYETFISIGKAGGDVPAISEGYGRLLSMALKAGISPEYIIKQLEGIGGETQSGLGHQKVKSLPDGIAKGIKRILELEGQKMNQSPEENKSSGNLCPDCGGPLAMQEGCQKCLACDYSKC